MRLLREGRGCLEGGTKVLMALIHAQGRIIYLYGECIVPPPPPLLPG